MLRGLRRGAAMIDLRPNNGDIAGIVLAGGRSSRMGVDKALLSFRGRTLVAHMVDVLRRVGIANVMVSGPAETVGGIDDPVPFSGPAQAMAAMMRRFPHYRGFLFVPVDMPLLDGVLLSRLLSCRAGGYFAPSPLPAFITPPYWDSSAPSVRGLLRDLGIYPLDLAPGDEAQLRNANTPGDWSEVSSL